MDEDIHKEDEHFKKAYERMEEDPSPEVWDRISGRLDKSDAIYYRSQFVTWKRIAVLLLLLLGGGVAYHFFTAGEKNEASQQEVLDKKDVAGNVAPFEKDSVDSQRSLQNPLSLNQNKSADTGNIVNHDERDHATGSEVFIHDHHQPHLHAQGDAETAGSVASAEGEGVSKKNNGNARERLPAEGADKRFMSADKGGKTVASSDSSRVNNVNGQSLSAQMSSASQIFDRSGLQPSGNDTVHSSNPLLAQLQKVKDPVLESYAHDRKNTLAITEEQGLQSYDSLHNSIMTKDSYDDKKNAVAKAGKAAQIKRKPFSRYWSVIPFASADMAGYSLDNDHDHDDDIPNGQPDHHDHRHEIEKREEHRFSFSAGALLKWQFSPKLSFRTGLVYSRVAIGIQPQTLYATKTASQEINYKFISSTGYAYVKPSTGNLPATGDSVTSDYANSSLQVITVPLSAGYMLPLGKRFFIIPNVGIAANVLMSTKVRTELNETTGKENVIINKLQGTRGVYASLLADAELHYIISRRVNIVMLPAFRYAIDPVTKENVVKTFPYNLSFGMGVSYRF